MPHSDNGTVPHTDNDTDTWHTVTQACKVLGISKRTLWRWVGQGRIKSKMEGRRRMVLIAAEHLVSAEDSATSVDDTVTGTVDDTPRDTATAQAVLIDKLESEVDYLRRQLEETTARYEEGRQRQDTIIMQLTRQLEQSQRLLEYHQDPWYRRWFRRRDREIG